jgi:hypothetical protein
MTSAEPAWAQCRSARVRLSSPDDGLDWSISSDGRSSLPACLVKVVRTFALMMFFLRINETRIASITQLSGHKISSVVDTLSIGNHA